MLRLVVFLSALAALAAAAPAKLQLTPEELNIIWETIDEDLKMRQFTAEAEIRALLLPMRVLVADAKTGLREDIKTAVKSYNTGVEALEKQYSGIASCVRAADSKLSEYDDTIIETYGLLFDRLGDDAEEEVGVAVKITTDAVEDLNELRTRVQACADEDCATKLDVEVVIFRDRMVKRVDDAITRATDATLIKLPSDLDHHKLNVERYQTFTNRLLREIRQCAMA